MSMGATTSVGRAKKDGGGAGEGVVAMGVALGRVEVIDTFEAKGFERMRSQAMQIYAYPHKPQVGHQVEISLIRGHPKR